MTAPSLEPGTSPWQKVVGILGLVVILWVGSETYDVVVGDFGSPEGETESDDGGGHAPPGGSHG